MTRLASFLRHYRVFTASTSWRIAEANRRGDTVVLAVVLVTLAYFAFSAFDWYVGQREGQARVEAEARIEHLEKIVVRCLSGQAIAVDNEVFLCETASLKIHL